MKKRRIQKRRSGTLAVISGLLIASAALRLVSSGSVAIAETSETPSVTANEQAINTAPPPESNVALFNAIKERENQLKLREDAVADRLQAISLAELEIQEQLTALLSAEEQLRKTIALADVAASNDLQSLTAVYENMKPKDAAALFEEMTPEFAAGFLGLMRADAAALIMTGLEPSTAYSISVILAGRNANVPVSQN